MYCEYFGLKELPFSIAPDPRYLYMSERHREALAHLVYGMEYDGGFVLLTGEVGTGKTTVCRCLLEQVPKHTDVAFIFNPKLTADELLATICDELAIDYPKDNTSIKVFVDRINAYLLGAYSEGRKTVLVIDEAQNLNVEVLEQIRLLTNLETNTSKLLQILLIGQPELREQLMRPELRQLAQRITARFHLGPLSKREVGLYVAHRLAVAGLRRKLFPSSCLKRIYRLSGGTPRLINILCDRALLGACVKGQARVHKKTLHQAAREVLGTGSGGTGRNFRWGPAVIALLCGAVALAAALYGPEFFPARLSARQSPVFSAPVPPAATIPGGKPGEEAPPASPLTSLHLPSGVSSDRSRTMAYAALLEQWGLTLAGGDACPQAEEDGLRCLFRRGTLRNLRSMNLPAVLSLFDEDGSLYYGTLLRLGDRWATLKIGGEIETIAAEDLHVFWRGDYSLLWRPPPHDSTIVRPGDRGQAVAWLEKRLAAIQGRQARQSKDLVFDEQMVREVKSFQLAQGLEPDGLVGAQTMLCLSRGDLDAGPTLSFRQEER